MKIFENTIINKFNNIKDDTLYFDIETTGFIHTQSFTYMIGMFYKDKSNLNFLFLFAQNKNDEVEILNKFNDIINNFSNICTFNGKAFDVPYLLWRFEEYLIPTNLDKKESIDMSRDFRPLKTILGLASQKQKSYESFLGHQRKDEYNGGQLISIYKEYSKNHSNELEHIITLHNFDDLMGMAIITDMYQFLEIKNSIFYDIEIVDDKIVMLFNLTKTFNRDYEFIKDNYKIQINLDKLSIISDIVCTKAKIFFKDYKNYYFLPYEDMAIHKSVSKYSKNKIKATAKNCYQYIDSCFMRINFTHEPNIKLNYEDEFNLIPIENINSYIANKILINLFN